MSADPTRTDPAGEAGAPGAAPGTAVATDEALIRKALSAEAPSRPNPIANALTFGWRGMLKIKHVPEQLLDVTLTPVMFTLMFTYLFGGAIAGSTGDYLQYILPGLLVMSVLFTTVYSGIALNTDKTRGVVDRFRSMPIWGPAPLLGALLGDGVRYVIAGTVIVVLGVILGYDPSNGIVGVLGAMGLVTLFSFALSWAFTTLGLLLRSPNAVMNAGFTAIFPLTFLSNVFVDPDTLPAGLEWFVDHNPISYLSDCCRGLMDGTVDGTDLTIVLATAVLLVAVFAPITVRLYNRG
jgi:ABC-2 type transport system permease protein